MDPVSGAVIATLTVGSLQGIYRILRGDARRAMLPSMASLPAPVIDKGLRRPRRQLDRSVEISSSSSARTVTPTPEVVEEIVEEQVVEDEPQPVDLPSAPDLDDTEVIGTEVEEAEQEDVFAERLGREGAASGEVQVSLIWFNKNDLDLSVVCPSGERISFDNKISNCGGRLDIDMNESGKRMLPREDIEYL